MVTYLITNLPACGLNAVRVLRVGCERHAQNDGDMGETHDDHLFQTLKRIRDQRLWNNLV